jgi:hypothetical protein
MCQYTFSASNIIAVTIGGGYSLENERIALAIAEEQFAKALASADDMLIPTEFGMATVDIYPGNNLSISCTDG